MSPASSANSSGAKVAASGDNGNNNHNHSTKSEHAGDMTGSTTPATTAGNNNNNTSNVGASRARTESIAPPPAVPMRGPVIGKKADRILITGKADLDQCDNQVISAVYTIYSFFPMVR
jgi:hypothetical protein